MQAAGVRTMAVGDVLELVFTDYYQTGGGNQAKDFTAEYKPAATVRPPKHCSQTKRPFNR